MFSLPSVSKICLLEQNASVATVREEKITNELQIAIIFFEKEAETIVHVRNALKCTQAE